VDFGHAAYYLSLWMIVKLLHIIVQIAGNSSEESKEDRDIIDHDEDMVIIIEVF
jgi:hypothetical protein